MAIVSPALVSVEYGQAIQLTISLSTAESTVGWTATCLLKAYNGGTTLATGTVVNTNTSTGVWTVDFTAAHTAQAPGTYYYEFIRTNSGYEYPIVEPSAFIIRPSLASTYPSLVSLSEYVAYALNSVTLSDAQAKSYLQMIFAAEEAAKQYCGRRFTYGTYVEYLDGNGSSSIVLRETPVTSITSIYEDANGYWGQGDGAFPASTLLTSGTQYALDLSHSVDGKSYSGVVHRIGVAWMNQLYRPATFLSWIPRPLAGSIKATYLGGFQNIPYDLKLAIMQMVTERDTAITGGRGVNSESGEGYSVSYASLADDMQSLASTNATLKRYRRGYRMVG